MMASSRSYLLLFLITSSSVAAFQTPVPIEKFMGTAALITTLIGAPVPVQESSTSTSTTPPIASKNIPPTAVEINVNVDKINPNQIARELYLKRDRLQLVAKDFADATKKLTDDVAGLVTLPPPDVQINPPADLKRAARDASIGRAKIVLNGEPVYLELRSEEGFLTVRFISSAIPKLPFLEPTDQERAELLMPPPPKPKNLNAVMERFNEIKTLSPGQIWNDFWETKFTIPFTETDLSYKTAAGSTSLFLGFAYGSTYAYYLDQNGLLFPQDEKAQGNKGEKKKPSTSSTPSKPKKSVPPPPPPPQSSTAPASTTKKEKSKDKPNASVPPPPAAVQAPSPPPVPAPVPVPVPAPAPAPKDISTLRKEVASTVDEERVKMERLEAAAATFTATAATTPTAEVKESSESPSVSTEQQQKKSPVIFRIVKKALMPWRKWKNLN